MFFWQRPIFKGYLSFTDIIILYLKIPSKTRIFNCILPQPHGMIHSPSQVCRSGVSIPEAMYQSLAAKMPRHTPSLMVYVRTQTGDVRKQKTQMNNNGYKCCARRVSYMDAFQIVRCFAGDKRRISIERKLPYHICNLQHSHQAQIC